MSDIAPDTGTEASNTEVPAEPAEPAPEVDYVKEAEKWKALAQKHEKRAKDNATAAAELEKVKLDAMSDTEKAVELARQQARAEVLTEVGGELVDLAVRAAVADRQVDVDALLEGLDRSRFLTPEGKADTDAIQKWVDRIVPANPGSRPLLDLGQGARDTKDMALNGDPLLQSVMNKVAH
jgi:hypothetical protein